ncbi:Transmembrane secretion effector [Virgibacillus subterraneus]|uniref:Transmembrane secretion effector n=1 Tax=Virgibacillus subterraneus TaxID=621109 RepID=A0A1H9GVD6_9BACI|nr:MFS transporter [Virgibacillus subterraneus]SEQ54025.1 Transmembrane secretion effector [Virgibacillus subterraneus]
MINLFKNRNFLLLFFGRLITNIGDSIYFVAAMWFVFELGQSSFYTGLAGFLILLPQSFQFLVGPLIERWDKKKILTLTQGVQAILLLIVSIMITYDLLTIYIFLLLIFIISVTNQISEPAEFAIIPEILPQNDLLKGNSILAFAYQGADLSFNALAGVLIALVGVNILFYVDTLTFIIGCLLFLGLNVSNENIKREINHPKDRVYFRELKDGFRYVLGFPLSPFILGIVVVNFVIGAMMANLPAYADWRGGPEVYGLFLTALFGGNLVGALTSFFLGRFPIGKLMIASYLLTFIFWISSVSTPNNLISILLFGASWIPIGATGVLMMTAIQTIVPTNFLARIMAVITSIATSLMPLGSILGGLIGTKFSQSIVFIMLGICFLFVSVTYFINPSSRNASLSSK